MATESQKTKLNDIIDRLSEAIDNFPVIDDNPKELFQDSLDIIEMLRDLFLEGFSSGDDHDLLEWEKKAKLIIVAQHIKQDNQEDK